MKVLVSGSSGFVGQRLLPQLAADGHTVMGLTHSRSPLFIHPQVEYKSLDLEDLTAVTEVVADYAPELIIDLAAIIDYSGKRRSQTINRNINMTAHLTYAAQDQGCRYFKISSIAALDQPDSDSNLISENSTWDYKAKHSPYAEAKKYSELEVWRAYAEGLDVMVLCPGVILGVGDEQSISHNFSQTITQAQKYYTYGVSLYVDVEDLVQTIAALMTDWKSGSKYIVGGYNISFRTLLETAASAIGYEPPTRELKPWMSTLYRYFFNLKQGLKGEKGFVSRANMQSLYTQSYYAHDKLQQDYPQIKYAPLEETLRRIHGRLS